MPPGAPNANPVPDGHPGMHDPAMIQAAQLLIPGDYQAARKDLNLSSDIGADIFHSALPYLPEDLNHFQEFTTFLDSIGLPAEWLPSEGEATQLNEIALEDPQKTVLVSQEQPKARRSLREESRGDSPFRSWLPSVPRGDQSLGALSDIGMFNFT